MAAVDCGTNSTRLLVAGADGRTARPPHAHHPAGPGGGRHRQARPRRRSARTLAVLAEYRSVMDRLGVGAARHGRHLGRARRRQRGRVPRGGGRRRGSAGRAPLGGGGGPTGLRGGHRRPPARPRRRRGGRHRGRVDRAGGRPRRARRGRLARHGLCALDRALPRATTRRPRASWRPPPRPCGRGWARRSSRFPASATSPPGAASSVWPGRCRPWPRSSRGSRSTTPNGSTTSCLAAPR